MRGTIAPHDIIYYHLIALSSKILFFLIPGWNMPAALGHIGRFCASIGLRFTHAGTVPPRHRAPRTPPGTVGANRGTNRPHRIDQAGTRHASPPLAAAGASRGCCPACLRCA